MIKLLIGGSPCTHWSIAQKNNRETEPEGLGWELFENYRIAKEKFKPDFFLYENNKSAAQAIKDQISAELGVDLMYINSALVSAQNRQRFYAFNWKVAQPKDRGIVLRDILESGENLSADEKPYALTTRCSGAITEDTLKRNRHTMVAEPINTTDDGTKARTLMAGYYKYGIATLLTNKGFKGGTTAIAEPCNVTKDGKSQCIRATYYKDGIRNLVANNVDKRTCVAEPVRVGALPIKVGEIGKVGNENYIVPYENVGECQTIQKAIPKLVDKFGYVPEKFNAYNLAEIEDKYPTLSTGSMVTSSCATTKFEEVDEPIWMDWDKKKRPIYRVENGLITIKGKQYPIKLADGCYIIRKLSPVECERLQTLPDGYTRAVSNAQRYRGLGNGWTAQVIIHILNGALKDVPRDEEIVVLSMYDGIGTGRYCLDKMGFTNVRYYAYEIDKYAKQVAMSNYPDIIQCGDAFDLRRPDWTIGY